MNLDLLQKLQKLAKKMSVNELKNMDAERLIEILNIDKKEMKVFADELFYEKVLSYKYNFKCPICNNNCTAYEKKIRKDMYICPQCGEGISNEFIIQHGWIIYCIEKKDLLDLQDEEVDLVKDTIRKSNIININEKRKEKMKIFISHSTEDKDYTNALVEMLHDIGISKSDDIIFCSSKEGYGIPIGEDIYEYLKQRLNEDIIVIFVLSKNYYRSVACLNEMGATWVNSTDYYSIMLPYFEYEKIKGAINPMKIAFKIEDRDKLTEFKDKIIEEFNLGEIKSQLWEKDRDKFLERILSLKKRDEHKHKLFKVVLEDVEKIKSNEIKLYVRFINEGLNTIVASEVQFELQDVDRNTYSIELPEDELLDKKFYKNENRIEVFTINLQDTSYNPNKHQNYTVNCNWKRQL